MHEFHGGIALTMQEAETLLADPMVGQEATEKDDLKALWAEAAALEIVPTQDIIVVFFPSPRKGEGGQWAAWVGGDWYVRIGGLARVNPAAARSRAPRCLRLRVSLFDIPAVEGA